MALTGTTPRWNFDYLDEVRDGGDPDAVAKFRRFQRWAAVLGTGPIEGEQTSPPSTPANNDTYLCAASATNDWTGHDGEFAMWWEEEDRWDFMPKPAGVLYWFNVSADFRFWNGTVWAVANI